MSAPEEAARHVAEAIGAGLTLLASKPWHDATTQGLHMLVEADVDLPADMAERDLSVPGYVVASLAQITARRAELLLIGT